MRHIDHDPRAIAGSREPEHAERQPGPDAETDRGAALE